MNNLFSSSPLAEDLMNTAAVPLRPGRFEKGLALQFLSGQYSGWPVVDSTREILGVVTELRLLQACSRVNSLHELRVEDTMATPVYVFEQDPLDVVMEKMVHSQVLRMPVVRDRQLVGVIYRGDVLRHSLPLSSPTSQFVFSCAWCERVHDPSEGLVGTDDWQVLDAYLSRHQLTFSDIEPAQTYCPSCLEILQALQPPSPGASGAETKAQAQAQEVRPCLLVVDDDPSVAGLLDQALQEWGYEVLVARNGREGLDLLDGRCVDGILLDMHMPIMDGRTMLDELRWLGHQMPVVMMSGASEESLLRRMLQEGAQGFFLKPFHLTSVQQACRKIFQKDEVKAEASSRFHVA